MKMRGKLVTLILTSTTLFFFLTIFSFIALAANNENSIAFQGNPEDAIKAYDKAIENNSQGSDEWYDKGTFHAFQGNFEEAIKAFDKAIEIDPQFASVWYNKGLCFVYLGNYEEAIKTFDKAIEIDPQDPDSWYNKGLCLAHLGKYKEAVEALDKAIEIAPQHDYALSLKESILLNSNKSFFSNSNIFVEEDDLLEYAQTYLKTYEGIINESNLTRDDLGLFSFYQSYPYSVNANISNTSGASITFIPHSIDKRKVSKVPYPIWKQIPKINQEFMNSNPIRLISINYNSSGIRMFNNTVHTVSVNGNVSGDNIWNNATDNKFIYINSSNNNCFYEVTDNTSIVLADGVHFNGLTYIDSNKLFRVDDLILNGTLVLKDSRVIMKSNLKKDWTKENAEEDAIDSIYKELIGEVFDYSKLTGIGFREIEPLVAKYKEREMAGYYEINKNDKWSDRQAIFNKADQYGIPHESVLVELLNNKQEETLTDKCFSFMDRFNTFWSFICTIILIIGWTKWKDIRQKLKI
jgi:outer membrane protein assembly factor BamD (BamD/ComL family)